ncbi:MAG: hypothetical protein IKT70_00635 [Clostridia bacterium]|nr:hypothetical protein [Clostridia bacterium]
MKRIICFALFIVTVFSLFSCKENVIGTMQEGDATDTVDTVYTGDVPDDFFFSLRFGTYGESSYDSQSGKLIKTRNSTHPEDYDTTLTLTEEEMREIYGLIRKININTYPDNYDPINPPDAEDKLMSIPYTTLSLTARYGVIPKTVHCEEVAFGGGGYDEKSRAFLDCVYRIRDIIVNSEEWKALPDYEFLHE